MWLGSGIQGQDEWDEDDADDHGDECEWSSDFDEVAELVAAGGDDERVDR